MKRDEHVEQKGCWGSRENVVESRLFQCGFCSFACSQTRHVGSTIDEDRNMRCERRWRRPRSRRSVHGADEGEESSHDVSFGKSRLARAALPFQRSSSRISTRHNSLQTSKLGRIRTHRARHLVLLVTQLLSSRHHTIHGSMACRVYPTRRPHPPVIHLQHLASTVPPHRNERALSLCATPRAKGTQEAAGIRCPFGCCAFAHPAGQDISRPGLGNSVSHPPHA